MSRLSIVVAICTYNNAALLDLTLSTIEKQLVDPVLKWEVLIVDNNSTDGTYTVAQRYMRRGQIPGLRVVREQMQGLSYARRCAVHESSSEMIAFIDDDCLLAPNWVEQAVAFYRDHQMAGAVGGKVQLQWEVPPGEILLRYQRFLAQQNYGDVPHQMPTVGWTYLVGAGLVVRRSALFESGWLDRMTLTGRRGNALSSGDDSEMVLRIRNAGYELWYNPAMQLQHYIPKRRISLKYFYGVTRGLGQSAPFLTFLTYNRRPTIPRRLRVLSSSLKALIQLSLSIIARDILRHQRIVPERRIAFNESLGRFEGAIRLLLQRSHGLIT